MVRVKVELNLEATKYLESVGKDPELFKFGKVCKCEHDFNGFGYSIRFKSNGSCLECSREYGKSDKRKEYVKEYNKKYRKENREYYKEYLKEYEKSDKRKEYVKEYEKSDKRKEHKQKYFQEYKKENPDIFLLHSQKRRARKRKATIHTITTKDIQKLLKYFNHRCVYCNVSIKNQIYHIDHVRPLINRGHHALYNLVPTCQTCNLSKNASNMKTWYRQQTFYSSEKLARIEKWMKMELINYKYDKNLVKI